MHPEIELARRNAEHDLRHGLESESRLVTEYLKDYEFRGDPGDHIPNEFEQVLLIDAIAGLTGDENFRALVAQNESLRKLLEGLPASEP